MPTGKDSQGKWLISLSDGKKIGEVKDLYLDEAVTKITAVFLGSEGVIHRKSFALARRYVQVMGDVWLISEADKITAPEDIFRSEGFLLLSQLRGREIQTEGGTKLGTVNDVILDAEGVVQGFSLGKVLVQGPLAERKTIARSTFTNVGSKDKPMIAELAKAETTDVPGA